ncbi:MAG: DNA polymerase III subunit delta' [Pseudomonadota bacterium]
MADLPAPDQIAGAPHPRDTAQLFGQHAAEAAFLDAFNSGRLHHAWLLTGPRGVGKATLAWRIARFLLATPDDDGGMFAAPAPATLDIAPGHPVARRLAAGSDPGVRAVTRSANDKGDRMRDQIVVDDIRALASFFQLSATDGGRRVVIIDAADEMNVQAANALLKMLEEPPERTTLLLIAHQPARLLPTIRSRCRSLPLAPLLPQDMDAALAQAGLNGAQSGPALAELAGGSAGAAIGLVQSGGLEIYAEIIALVGTLPQLDRARALALAEAAAQRGAEEKRRLLFALLDIALARLARTGASGRPPEVQAAPHESTVLSRLAPTPHAGRIWAQAAQTISARAAHGLAVNLDPAALVLDTFRHLTEAARAALPVQAPA